MNSAVAVRERLALALARTPPRWWRAMMGEGTLAGVAVMAIRWGGIEIRSICERSVVESDSGDC